MNLCCGLLFVQDMPGESLCRKLAHRGWLCTEWLSVVQKSPTAANLLVGVDSTSDGWCGMVRPIFWQGPLEVLYGMCERFVLVCVMHHAIMQVLGLVGSRQMHCRCIVVWW
jgi:hypothetical protein